MVKSNKLIAHNFLSNCEFKVFEVIWQDGSITYNVYGYVGSKVYNYNGFKKIESAFKRMKMYQEKAYKKYSHLFKGKS